MKYLVFLVSIFVSQVSFAGPCLNPSSSNGCIKATAGSQEHDGPFNSQSWSNFVSGTTGNPTSLNLYKLCSGNRFVKRPANCAEALVDFNWWTSASPWGHGACEQNHEDACEQLASSVNVAGEDCTDICN